MKVRRTFQSSHLIMTASICLLLLSIIAYIYFLSLSVVHVVMRKEVQQELLALRSEIVYLESNYIDAKHQISSSLATLPGFTINEQKIFITSRDSSLVVRPQN
jgi:hypothetical protein